MLFVLPLALLLVLMFVPRVHVAFTAVLGFDPVPWIAGAFALLCLLGGAFIGAGLLVAGLGVYLYRNRRSASLSGPEKPDELDGGK